MENVLPGRILVVRLGAIGDVTNALIVAAALEEERPDVRIGWAVHDLAQPLVEGHPCVDRVHLWRRSTGLSGFRSLVRELRAERYDLALDLQRIQKSALCARLSGAARVVGFDRRRTKEGSWIWTRERIPPGDPGAHVIEQYLDVARYLGVRAPRVRRLLPSDPAAEAWAEGLVSELGAPPLVLCLGASKPPNRWLPERFAALARLGASELGLPVCLVGGPGERERLGAVLGALADAPGIRDLVGRTGLSELVSLERRARLFVGCDTGPMHLAAAVDTPVVALFGPADSRRTGPYGSGHRVLRSSTGTMDGIAVEEVAAAVAESL